MTKTISQPIRVNLISLGCSKNQVDSEVMLGLLRQDGFELTPDTEKAEVIIVNTCGFIDAAKEESIDTLIELGKLKKKGPCQLLIAAGCLAQRYGDQLLSQLPELDAVVGTGDFPEIAKLCQKLSKKTTKRSEPYSMVSQPAFLYDVKTPRLRLSPRHWAYVKISEGCNYRCAFCSIPSFRGDIKSRPADSIVAELEQLASEGVKEINLIAQSLTSYGLDWKKKGELPKLLKRLTAVDGVRWIRLFYAYPTDLTDELIELIVTEDKICSYVDLPLQHIDDEVLKQMRRKGDSRLIRSLLEKLRSRISNLSLRSTFIVGFPGETEVQFQRLLDFVGEGWFTRIGVFSYSHEEGTPAYEFSDSISLEEKNERLNRLMALQEEISLSKNQALIGTIREVMVEDRDEETQELFGRLEGQAPEIDGVVALEGDARPGEFVKVEITGATELDLSGKILRMS